MKNGWISAELSKYVNFIDYRGRTPVKTESGITLITAKNVKLGYLSREPQEFIAEDNYESWMTRGIPNVGDVIFTTEAPLANVAQIDTDEKLAFAQRIIVMQPDADILTQSYLKYLLLSKSVRDDILSKGTGATVKGIKSQLLKKVIIPIAPLQEQQQIVEKLDQAFELIDQAKANIEQNIINAKELFQSKLDDLFCATVGVEYKFKEVCNLVGGSQPSKENFIYEPREGYIRLVQVRDFRTDKFITYIPKEKASKFFTKDDIMIGRYGPPIFGIFKGLEGAYNVALMKAIPNHELVDDNYLYWYLQNKPLFNFVDKSSTRAAGQSGIRKELLDEYPVFLSDIENQKKIVALITEIKNSTDSLIKSYQQKLDNLEELRKSILEKAFRGELTN